MNTRVLALLVPALWASAAAGGVEPPEPIIEPVAHTGDPAPGIPDATFVDLGLTQIDGEGNLLFLGWLTGPEIDASNDLGLFYGPPGDVQKLLWESEPAPDMPEGVVIAELLYASLGFSEDTGWITITPGVGGPGIEPGINNRVLLVGPPGDFQKVLQAGDQAPGCEPGLTIREEYFGGRLSDNATLYVTAKLTGPGVTDANDRVHWTGTRDNLELVYREGMQAPGCDPGVVFAGADSITHNDAGQIAFRGLLNGVGVTIANDNGRWLGGPGTLTKIAREGDPLPGMEEGVTWKTVAGGATATNSFGDVVETGRMEGPGVTEADDYVLFVGDGDGLYLAAREGDPAPEAGPGVYFEWFNGRWVNNRGEAFYRVQYAGPGITVANRSAMYFGPFGAGQLTLRDGDPAPTFSPGITLSRIVAVSNVCALNDVGDIVTPTEIEGPGVTDENKAVMWLRHRVLQRWIPLLRGDSRIDGRVLYAPDESDFGTAYCNPTGGADGLPQSLNDQGMLAIVLEFTDGSEGLFRISPPPFGDGDQDGDVDLADWSLMESCSTGPDGGVAPDCAVFDLDWDGDVDLDDHRFFQQLFEGA